MFFSEIDPDFPESLPFVFRVRPDDSPIDVGSLVAWAKGLDIAPQIIVDYAAQFQWENQLRRVVGLDVETKGI